MGGAPAKEVMMHLYVRGGLEVAVIVTFVAMCCRDSRTTRTSVFCFYTLYAIVLTGLQVYEAVEPSPGMRRLGGKIAWKICEKLKDAHSLSRLKFEDERDCSAKIVDNSGSIDLALIGISVLFKSHFMHVLCSHMKNASLSRAKGGCAGHDRD